MTIKCKVPTKTCYWSKRGQTFDCKGTHQSRTQTSRTPIHTHAPRHRHSPLHTAWCIDRRFRHSFRREALRRTSTTRKVYKTYTLCVNKEKFIVRIGLVSMGMLIPAWGGLKEIDTRPSVRRCASIGESTARSKERRFAEGALHKK